MSFELKHEVYLVLGARIEARSRASLESVKRRADRLCKEDRE